MNTNQLKYFVTVAEKKSMKKAAEDLYITHQCLSASIKRLEDEFNTNLFERTNQGVFLNENGKAVYEMARKILAEIEDTKKGLTKKSDLQKQILRIEHSFGLSEILFVNVVKQFRKKHANIYLTTQSKSSLEAIENLRLGKVDLIYVGVPEKYDEIINQEFICTDIFEEKMDLLLPYNHILSNNSVISLSSALKYPVVLYQNVIDDEKNFMLKRMQSVNENVDIFMICDNMDIHHEAIAEGMGIGFIGRSIKKSKEFTEKMQQLNLKSIRIKDGFQLRIMCLVNKESMAEKEIIISDFRKIFSKEMYLKKRICKRVRI